ncbi:MAG: hypothetical protein IT359_12640 [Gemmatimonadaceae bacterium]|nr:hypothetical protein [Gemmatimonadaceae bacterium]
MIDPEALLLISLVLVDEERRLADLIQDWGVRNSDLLSVQRTKNLAALYPEHVHDAFVPSLRWFARVSSETGKDLRWSALANEGRDERMPALASESGRATSRDSADDTAPASVRRSPGKSRATRANLTSAPMLIFRLRLGLGVGTKADLIAYLLGSDEAWHTVRDIATATGYTVAATRRAVDDLAAARMIESREGQPARYRANVAAWAPLLALDRRPPQWGSWHERYVFTAAFLAWERSARERPLSDYAFGVHGRDLLETYRPAFARDPLATWSEHTPVADWKAFVEEKVHSLVNWMESTA